MGAVLGLILVMNQLDDMKKVGHGIAAAFVATITASARPTSYSCPPPRNSVPAATRSTSANTSSSRASAPSSRA
ncbi:MAG: MotA/TolQ/ExbB proton channel family protein [Desulfobacterales bacterium]|nr:MotA/TolQ/ExbB proton channel family protein [Desulfobacterales bacterium]